MSTVILDTITGKSTATTITIGSTPVVSASANSMTIRGEGSAQTSIQQGLAKAWINFTGISTTAERDSFNVSGLTDGGTGNTTVALSSNMSNTNYTGSWYQNGSTGSAKTSFNNAYGGGFGDRATNSVGVFSYSNTQFDAFFNDLILFGDLA